MCGRYSLHTPLPKLLEAFGFASASDAVRERYNVAPSQDVPVLTNAKPEELQLFHWGLIPSWAKEAKIGNSLINARAETLATKPAFRSAFKRRRCLVLADGFYEWQRSPGSKLKQPWHFRLKGAAPFAFAGLWEVWKEPASGEFVRSCSIITTTPNELEASIHNRMPVILPPSAYAYWLASVDVPADKLASFLVPYPASEMEAFPVTTRVNSPKNQGPELLQTC